MEKLIEVKKKHITKGNGSDERLCAVALALTDAGFDEVEVDGDTASFKVSVPLSKEVRKFIQQFDAFKDGPQDDYNERTGEVTTGKAPEEPSPLTLRLLFNGKKRLETATKKASKKTKKARR